MVATGNHRWNALLGLIACTLGVPTPAQQACSPFEAATVQLKKDQAPFRRMVDLDLDGDLDVIGARLATDGKTFQLVAYENDGAGVFSQVWSGANSAPPVQGRRDFLIETGFLNSDPYPDICVMYRGNRFDWIGSSFKVFYALPPIALPEIALRLVLAELDGDGRSEVVWADEARLHLITSSGAHVEVSHSVPQVQSLRLIPKDGPIQLDEFIVTGLWTARLVYGSPAYGLVAGPIFQVGPMAKACDTADVDGDGDIDAVFFLAENSFVGTPPSYRVLRRLAPASWVIEDVAVGGPGEFLADIDGDGDPDGVCCGGGGGSGIDYNDNVRRTDFEISINDGSGAFAPAFQIQGLGSPQLAGAVDVDADGDVDLVAGRCVYYACGPLRPPVAQETGFEPRVMRGLRDISDCDGDGDPDVGFSVDSVYTNDGRGRFSADVPLVSPAPRGTEFRGPGFPGDLDGDGDVDLLVEVHGEGKHRGYGSQPVLGMGFLQNDGAGRLRYAGLASEPLVSFGIDSLEAEASLLADLDRDGDLDLITRSMIGAPSASRVWIDDGRGRFQLWRSVDGLRIEWAGDVDLDADVDLLLSRPFYYSHELQLFLAVPRAGLPPTFVRDGRLAGWTMDPFRGWIAEGDYVQDGYPDFLIARTVGNWTEALALFNTFNVGGSIAANVGLDYGYDLEPDARVALGDLNGDGLCDALTGAHLDDPVPISEVQLKKTPGGVYRAFDMAQQLLTPGLLVDIDTDGDLDLLGERIVFNRTQ